MNRILFWVLLIVAVALIELSSLAWPVERLIYLFSKPIVKIASSEQTGNADTNIIRKEMIERLFERENAELRKTLAFKERTQHSTIGADVIGYSTDSPRSELLINRGSRDGVRPGAPAIAGDGVLVGRVHTVDAQKSTILLLRDTRSKILALITRDDAAIHGIAEGRFNVGVDLTFIPVTEVLKQGDVVITSGLQEGIAAGFIIGTVQEVRKKPEDLFQTAVLAIPYPKEPPPVISIISENDK